MNENKVIQLFLNVRHNMPRAYDVFRNLVREIVIDVLIESGLVEIKTDNQEANNAADNQQ